MSETKAIQVKIITPKGVVAEDEATSVQVPGITGYFMVKWNHLPIIALLQTGRIIIRSHSSKRIFAANGGYFEFAKNRIVILVESVEESSNIDISRAEQARDKALERLSSAKSHMDVMRARAALTRAKNRIKVAAIK